MNDIVIFERDWGNLVFSFCLAKMDVFPRLTFASIARAMIINIGFLFFTFNFTIWDAEMREFNRRNRERMDNVSQNG